MLFKLWPQVHNLAALGPCVFQCIKILIIRARQQREHGYSEILWATHYEQNIVKNPFITRTIKKPTKEIPVQPVKSLFVAFKTYNRGVSGRYASNTNPKPGVTSRQARLLIPDNGGMGGLHGSINGEIFRKDTDPPSL